MMVCRRAHIVLQRQGQYVTAVKMRKEERKMLKITDKSMVKVPDATSLRLAGPSHGFLAERASKP